MKMSRASEKIAARVIVVDDETDRALTLTIFDPEINLLVDGVPGDDIKFRLLGAAPAEFTFDRRNVVVNVTSSPTSNPGIVHSPSKFASASSSSSDSVASPSLSAVSPPSDPLSPSSAPFSDLDSPQSAA